MRRYCARIDRVVDNGQLASDVATSLKETNQADEPTRAGRLWFCFFAPRLGGEPMIPASCQGDGVLPCERLAFTVPLGAYRRNARFNLSLPFSKARLSFMFRCVRWQFEVRFSSHTAKTCVLVAHIFRNNFAGNPATV